MAEFNIRSDAVDVTKIMEQIRERIREKRGADYTEQQIRELANVKLEGFFDPNQVRSDLVEHFKRLTDSAQTQRAAQNAAAAPPAVFDFNQDTIYVSSRGPMGKLIHLIRKILILRKNQRIQRNLIASMDGKSCTVSDFTWLINEIMVST